LKTNRGFPLAALGHKERRAHRADKLEIAAWARSNLHFHAYCFLSSAVKMKNNDSKKLPSGYSDDDGGVSRHLKKATLLMTL